MICARCGYDDKKPLGRAVHASKEGEDVEVDLNENGMRAILCSKGHLRKTGDVLIK